MRVLCRHGHFAFYPRYAGDIARFTKYYDITLQRDGDFFTFPPLVKAPRYSIALTPYINIPAVKTFEGQAPWEVFRENGFVYHMQTGLIIPKLSVITLVDLPQSNYCYMLPPNKLLQPGTYLYTGQQVLSYDAEFVQDTFTLRISEVSFE